MEDVLNFLEKNGISILAAFISVMAILYARKNTKKQIRVGKIEEIHESLNSLLFTYSILKTVLDCRINSKDVSLTDEKRKAYTGIYNEILLDFERNIARPEIPDRINRLNVLAKIYLKDHAKIEIIAFTEIVLELTSNVFYTSSIDTKFKFPTARELEVFTINLENQFIKLIDIGGKEFNAAEQRKQIEEVFRRLGVKA
jgi:hypothetical protein